MPLNFDNIKTPPNHLDTLIEPSAKHLLALVEDNRRLARGHDFSVMDLHISDVRALARRAVVGGDDRVVIAAGHQPEFIHPGVWAKHAVVQRLAEAMNGVPLNLVVDQDIPKSARIDVPVVAGDHVRVHSPLYGRIDTTLPFENQPPADPQASRGFGEQIRQALGDRFDDTLIPTFLDSYAARCSATDWVDQSVGARKDAERVLGVRVEDHRVSQICTGPLLGQLLTDARRFAVAYNRSLDRYRAAYRIRTPNRPVPPLECSDDQCETPLWAYRRGEPRRRLFVRQSASRFTLVVDDEIVVEMDTGEARSWERLEGCLRNCSWRLRPRALMLTLWARLLVCDFFVHGIGGAQYDRMTDFIMGDYFKIEPPKMGCVSATLYPPIYDRKFDPQSLSEAKRALRDVHFNPQRHVRGMDDLVRARESAVKQAQLLRRERPADRVARREAFERIRDASAAILESTPSIVTQYENRVHELEAKLRDHQIATRRDYFFALYPEKQLRELLDRLPDVHDFK